jgi:hypothetical protein
MTMTMRMRKRQTCIQITKAKRAKEEVFYLEARLLKAQEVKRKRRRSLQMKMKMEWMI